jgi:hypothetical protein
VKHLILAKYDDENYGYLRIYVDKDYLKIGFHKVGVRSLAQSRYDMVTVRLKDHHMVLTELPEHAGGRRCRRRPRSRPPGQRQHAAQKKPNHVNGFTWFYRQLWSPRCQHHGESPDDVSLSGL